MFLISGAAHHFVSSSFANHPDFLQREGDPFVEINPQDAASRRIENGDLVILENGRGWCELRAVVTDNVRPGVLASPKGRWSKNGRRSQCELDHDQMRLAIWPAKALPQQPCLAAQKRSIWQRARMRSLRSSLEILLFLRAGCQVWYYCEK